MSAGAGTGRKGCDMYDPNDPLMQTSVPAKSYVPNRIEGLPTTGIMGTAPTVAIGGIMGVAALILSFLQAAFGWSPPADLMPFFDAYGTQIVGAAVGVYTIVQAAITYFKVFSPRSAAEIAAGVR